MTIRKQSLVRMSLPKYREQGAFRFVNSDVLDEPYSDARLLDLYRAKEWDEFLRGAVLAHKNIVISAGTYCGKTTCLNALVQEIPAHERIVTIEDSREIEPAQPNCVRLSYARHQASGQAAVTPTNVASLVHATHARPGHHGRDSRPGSG